MYQQASSIPVMFDVTSEVLDGINVRWWYY